MDNTAKIYSLYFAFVDVIMSICMLMKNQEYFERKDKTEFFNCSKHNINSNEIFQVFLLKGRQEYFNLKNQSLSQLSLSSFKAQQKLERLKRVIEQFIGELESDNLDLIFPLWLAYNLALDQYFCLFPVGNKPNLWYKRQERLRLGYQKYLSSYQSNSDWWQSIDGTVKLNLGNF